MMGLRMNVQRALSLIGQITCKTTLHNTTQHKMIALCNSNSHANIDINSNESQEAQEGDVRNAI